MARQLLGYADWSAYVSATATIVTFVSAILFFTLGQPFGTLNDIASVFQVIFMLPLALILYRLLGPYNRFFSASPTMKPIRMTCSCWRNAVDAGRPRLYIPPTCVSNEASSVGLIIAARNQSNCVASRE